MSRIDLRRQPLRFQVLSLSLIGLAILALANTTASIAKADWMELIGYDELLSRYGDSVPTGAGLTVSLVEYADDDGNYFPDTTRGQFNNKNFVDGSGGGTTASSHATGVAAKFFGNNGSIAPGIADIVVYEADNWLASVVEPASGGAPLQQPFAVQNHSWVGSTGDAGDDVTLLQRIDHIVNRDEVLMSVGIRNNNNGSNNVQHPNLLSQAYNVVAVGRSDGLHSRGTTTIYGSGRVRPDIVAPGSNVSQSTAMVSSAAAVLNATAREIGDDTARTNALRSETQRAILLAGATKDQFPDWNRTETRPLDELYGAGQVNVLNSYEILTAGEQEGFLSEPTSSVGPKGYDYVEGLGVDETLYYAFEVSDEMLLTDFTIALTWNMEITDADPSDLFDPEESIADMSLQFFDSSEGFLSELLDQSVSPVDNREYLFFEQLGAGTYTLAVTTDRDQDFAVAWGGTVQAVPEPSSVALFTVATIAFVLTCRRRRQRLN